MIEYRGNEGKCFVMKRIWCNMQTVWKLCKSNPHASFIKFLKLQKFLKCLKFSISNLKALLKNYSIFKIVSRNIYPLETFLIYLIYFSRTRLMIFKFITNVALYVKQLLAKLLKMWNASKSVELANKYLSRFVDFSKKLFSEILQSFYLKIIISYQNEIN